MNSLSHLKFEFVLRKLRAFPFATQSLLILLTTGLALYACSLNNEFLLDDEEQIVNNRLTESISYFGKIFSGASTGEGGSFNSYGVYFRPLMLALFALLRMSFGLEPMPFHILQLGFHIGAALMLALILRHFTTEAIALLGSVIFLIHPMNVEAVSYIAALQDPLCAFFSLLCFWLVATAPTLGRRKLAALFLLATVALLSKETAILYFFVVVMATLIFRKQNKILETLRVAFALGLSMSLYFVVRAGVAGLTTLAHDSTQLARASFDVKLLTLPALLASYLAKFFFPLRLATTQDWVVRSLSIEDFVLPILFVSTTSALCLWYIFTRRHKLFLFFFIWTLAGLGFHSHLVAALDGTIAERWFYMPCMGMIGMLASVTYANQAWLTRYRLAVATVLALFVIGFSVRTFLRSQDWRDGYTLFTTDIVHQEDSAHLQNNVGVELFRRGQITQAKGYFERSIELNPKWKISWNNLGAVYHRNRNLAKAEECYRKSIDHGPYLLAYRGYAGVLLQQDRINEAKHFLKIALTTFPADPELLQFDKHTKR
jgi:hypothetical protein